ncbi:MAG: hypothetical protein CMB20_000275 [Methanobacteriota archaeon]|nr:MAG: hypothetical protein CMB20_000275 [Euryarchaeota archaeon]|tara:strand:+ start:1569 stop:2402 length:834 start_codon:yes stop_codon:yes gene_type:complete
MIISGTALIMVITRIIWDKYKIVQMKIPALERDWVDDCKHLTTASYKGSKVTLKNVRDFTWISKREHDNKWTDLKVDLNEIVDIWFVIDHFHKIRGMAHTMLTFQFKDDKFITFSFETRREVGERYHPWHGLWRAYELYLLVATEKDALHLRTNIRGNKVHLFRVQAPPGKDKALFNALCDRANKLASNPEWYHSLTKTCTTAIVDQVNLITPGRIPRMWRTLLPGHSARAAWKLKLIEDWGGYDATLEASRVDDRAKKWNGKEDFSTFIRAHFPPK